jgi:hypothetical protein
VMFHRYITAVATKRTTRPSLFHVFAVNRVSRGRSMSAGGACVLNVVVTPASEASLGCVRL